MDRGPLPAEQAAVPSTSGSDGSQHSEDPLALLPRHTKVLVKGNNRTKSALVNVTGVVKTSGRAGGLALAGERNFQLLGR